MTDFLDEKRREINERLAELKPVVDEYKRLQAGATALARVGGSTAGAAAAPVRRGPGRPRGSRSRTAAATRRSAASGAGAAAAAPSPAAPRRRAGRRKGSGTRAAQALSLITGAPGITIPELAEKMGIGSTSYLYRVLPGLRREGKIAKRGRGWHPKGA